MWRALSDGFFEINTHDETAAEEKNAPRLSARLLDVKLHHAHSRKSIDAEYLEAHKRMKARIQKTRASTKIPAMSATTGPI